jgi:delta 1-pyrroline-5-carboxylate dehydrogenase
MTLNDARERSFTGEIVFETEPEVRAYLDNGVVYFAERATDVGLARRLEAGNTYINAHRLGASVPLVPSGGVKQSGLGRTHGMHSLHHCTEEHAIVGFTDAATQLPGIAHWQTIMNNQEASR